MQTTIQRRVTAIGTGIHKGSPVRLALEPAEADEGIVFYRSDCQVAIPLSIESVVDTTMATVIGTKKVKVSTIEHLLAALYAYGLDNLRIVIDADELPVMDGSAISFCILLDEAGMRVLDKPRRAIRLKRTVECATGEQFVRMEPSAVASFAFGIEFPHPAIGRQFHECVLAKQTFVEEIARARTFGFIRDMQALQRQSLALGASLKNAIGLDDRKVLNRYGLRFENEFVRHKILDAMGDMMVAGHRIVGRYSAFAGSHKLNHLLLKKIFESEANYEIVEYHTI